MTVTARWLSRPLPKRRSAGQVVDPEGVVEPIGRARVFVVHDAREHHVADVGVERRGLAEHVDALQHRGVHRHLAQDVVRGQPERVVDVDHHRLALRQGCGIHLAEARVEALGDQLGQRDQLGRYAQRGGAAQVRDAALLLRAPARLAALLPMRVEVEPRHEVEEVLPGPLRAPLPEGGQLLGQDVALGQGLHEVDERLLALAGDAGGDVHQAVRIRADEVHRRVAEALLGEGVVDRVPPAPGHARVADLRSAQHPNAEVHAPLGDQPHAFLEAVAPRLAQPFPVVRRAAESLGAGLGRRLALRWPARRPLAHADLVPLDLERHERGDQVVHVRGARQQHRVCAVARVVPAAPPRRGVGLVPVVDHDAVASEDLRLLAHDHELGSRDPVGQAADRVDQGAEIGLVGVGQGMQARAHLAMGRFEHAQVRLAARAQKRVVGALVELDLVAQARRHGLVGGACEHEARDRHRATPSRRARRWRPGAGSARSRPRARRA